MTLPWPVVRPSRDPHTSLVFKVRDGLSRGPQRKHILWKAVGGTVLRPGLSEKERRGLERQSRLPSCLSFVLVGPVGKGPSPGLKK